MERLNLQGLVAKWRSLYNSNVVSINDLIIREMEGGHLSCNQLIALKNFNTLRIKDFTAAANEKLFSEKSYVYRLAANVVPYKEFI